MNPTLKNFIENLRVDPRFSAFADGTESAIRDIELEAVRNWHARRFLQALEWIVHPVRERTIVEKIEAIAKLDEPAAWAAHHIDAAFDRMEVMRRPKREDELGPAMLALKERQRAFVTCLLLEPPGHGAQVNAARRAGYGTAKTKLVHMANIASRLVRHPKVVAAIVEESRKMLRTGSSEAVNALLAMIRDPNHKGHVRAIGMMLERTDPTIYHQHVTVERKQSEEEMIEFVRRFAKEIGVDESRLLGCNRALPIEAEFVEVHDAPPGVVTDH